MNDFWHDEPIEALASVERKVKYLEMSKILEALRQSFESLLSLRMFLLVIIPPMFAVGVIFFIFFASWEGWSLGLTNFLHTFGPMNWLENLIGFHEIAGFVAMIALVLLFIPMAYLTAVIFTSIFVLPIALKWVAEADFKHLEKKRGGSIVGSLWNTLFATGVFVVAFFVTLPLWFLPGFQLLVPLILTSWLNKKVFLYDVLQDYASQEERRQIEKEESHRLYGMGMLLGLCSYIPLAIFIVPVFSALSYTYYGLNELSRRRGLVQGKS
ncbi:EI24 domain-containing protein [Bdellovibrio svalbardensis]|uniref:EI24 domain-containing protein n=1 Tax=Bdellovibrio svalbardensis TaxID=2972972 RepID=A0ABT6DNH4_9BACT|nr:EI24 domain-containing protein [Bdellovibrio svalbardensis]MDG0817381.1 EI24 domain-containing protein [Bdellovibrio svalbardensis]